MKQEPEVLMKMEENRAMDFGEFIDSIWATADAATRCSAKPDSVSPVSALTGEHRAQGRG